MASKFDAKMKAIKNDKWKAFIMAYLELSNATKAYMKAYKVSGDVTAGSNGYKLLKNTQIKSAIQAFNDELWKNRKEHIGDTFNLLLKRANADIGDVVSYDKKGVMKIKDFKKIDTKQIASVTQRVTKDGITDSIKMHDSTKALEMTLKVLEMMSDKQELNLDITVVPAKRKKKAVKK